MQWKVRFYGSALGYLWQLIRPLLLFLVLYVFFTEDRTRRQARARATTTTAPSSSARSSCSRSSPRRRWALCERGGQRDTGSQDPVPAHGYPTVGRAPRVLQPCLNLIVVTIFTLIAGVKPMLSWLECR